MINPWGILVDIPEQIVVETVSTVDAKYLCSQIVRSCDSEFQSAADAALTSSDTIIPADVDRPINAQVVLAPVSTAHNSKLEKKKEIHSEAAVVSALTTGDRNCD